jgi:N-methylhydantoinase A
VSPSSTTVRTIGVDTGGTFTDLVAVEGDEVRAEKVPSTPDDPSRAVLEGIEALGGADGGTEVVHGTTVALNALLTGEIAPTALVTNRGFRDLIEIGRQTRSDLYALHPKKPKPPIPRPLRFEIGQRTWPGLDGGIERVEEPTTAELARLRKRIEKCGAKSVAVCLLHAYADAESERLVARALEPLGLPVTCSAGILPEYREYERFSTAAVNAALVPLMGRYLAGLERALGGGRLSILQSSGGTLAATDAAREPARVLLSGPAGGVVGAARAARQAGLGDIVTLDMGGTSTDVAFHHGHGRVQDAVCDTHVAGLPVALPSLDIHTIGCGGGSVVRVDAGGLLRVGPESAGADPGPVCHGRGSQPTVTDAHVLLGHLSSGTFAGGSVRLDTDAVARAFERLADRLGTRPKEAAAAVLDVAQAAMRRALGVMTMQRGHDPRRLPLVAFGGAGGLHAAALAEALDLPGALVPRLPGCLSAFGMAHADALVDRSRTVLAPLAEWKPTRRRRARGELAREGRERLVAAGHRRGRIEIESSLELRYRGQSYEISVADEGMHAVEETFHARHEALYGWRLDEREIELVCLRVRAVVRAAEVEARAVRSRPLPAGVVTDRRRVVFGGSARDTAVVAAWHLRAGHRFSGPAVVEDPTGTILVPPGWTARVTIGGHLALTRGRARLRGRSSGR